MTTLFQRNAPFTRTLVCLAKQLAYVVTITGTPDGRIFMGAKDGCIYKFFYQAEEGFSSRQDRKINHSKITLSYLIPSFINAAFSEEDPVVQMVQDESRHILYTRSEKGSINIYDLGTDGRGMSRVAAINISSIAKSSCQHCQNVGSILF